MTTTGRKCQECANLNARLRTVETQHAEAVALNEKFNAEHDALRLECLGCDGCDRFLASNERLIKQNGTTVEELSRARYDLRDARTQINTLESHNQRLARERDSLAAQVRNLPSAFPAEGLETVVQAHRDRDSARNDFVDLQRRFDIQANTLRELQSEANALQRADTRLRRYAKKQQDAVEAARLRIRDLEKQLADEIASNVERDKSGSATTDVYAEGRAVSEAIVDSLLSAVGILPRKASTPADCPADSAAAAPLILDGSDIAHARSCSNPECPVRVLLDAIGIDYYKKG